MKSTITKVNNYMENKTKPAEQPNEEPIDYVEEFVQLTSFTMEAK